MKIGIFDFDDTLRYNIRGLSYIDKFENLRLLPNLQRLQEFDKLAGISNQGSVAHGLNTINNVVGINHKFIQTLQFIYSVRFTEVQVSFYHKDGKYEFENRSKPLPTMLTEIFKAFKISRQDEIIFVGNSFSDLKCYQNKQNQAFHSNFQFEFAHKFFRWKPEYFYQHSEGYFYKNTKKIGYF